MKISPEAQAAAVQIQARMRELNNRECADVNYPGTNYLAEVIQSAATAQYTEQMEVLAEDSEVLDNYHNNPNWTKHYSPEDQGFPFFVDRIVEEREKVRAAMGEFVSHESSWINLLKQVPEQVDSPGYVAHEIKAMKEAFDCLYQALKMDHEIKLP